MNWTAWIVVAEQVAIIIACILYFRVARHKYRKAMRTIGIVLALYITLIYILFGLRIVDIGNQSAMLGRIGMQLLSALYLSEIIADIRR